MNYFELYGIPEKPVTDKTSVSKKYIELQKKFHPDFYTNETEDEKEIALSQSAEINKAYNIFINPDKTIEYFLQLKGIITPDEKYTLPADFLMEMMELNEELDDHDTAETNSTPKNYEKKLQQGIAGIYELGSLGDEELLQLKEYYYKKKYLKRILERLDD